MAYLVMEKSTQFFCTVLQFHELKSNEDHWTIFGGKYQQEHQLNLICEHDFDSFCEKITEF